jgi:predicted Zn-dependent protease
MSKKEEGMRIKTFLSLGLIVCLIAIVITCATTGPGGEKDLILISTAQEKQLGAEFDKQVRAQSEIYNNESWNNYFNEIGQSIVAVSDRKDLDYKFTVIKSDDVNAFAVPGGYIYIYTGLLDIIENEAQLAAVTSHEISHVVARHSIKRIQQVMGIQILYQIVVGEASSEALDAVIGLGLNVALSGYSREYEREADQYGVFYMEKAGYNPEGAIGLFAQLREAHGGASEDRSFFENLFASHPETQERINNVEEQLGQYSQEVLNRHKNRDKYQQMKSLLP